MALKPAAGYSDAASASECPGSTSTPWWRRGRPWGVGLPALPLEDLLGEPLAEVRQRLGLVPPVEYKRAGPVLIN
ncbi:hypothetical protein Q6D67_14715 [Haliea sp. E1-2-M8]|uniref:hypothetical protein n=1 Tax=Haliea sp. E1-2-M8 TaxID=3064706 RepID=UPI0027272E93|nr:hypothetical protein [Haliea sp. E1-2-M8]MDO8862959.1 hypothetical protein [Haliea sp. E1-2-M8]